MAEAPVTWTSRPCGVVSVRCSRRSPTTALAASPASATLRLIRSISNDPSSDRKSSLSSGRVSAVAVSVTTLLSALGASALMDQAAKSSRYWRSASVRPPSRWMVMEADDEAVEPGNARSMAFLETTLCAVAGRNVVWSVEPEPARLGENAPKRPAATTQARTTRNRKRKVMEPRRSNMACGASTGARVTRAVAVLLCGSRGRRRVPAWWDGGRRGGYGSVLRRVPRMARIRRCIGYVNVSDTCVYLNLTTGWRRREH